MVLMNDKRVMQSHMAMVLESFTTATVQEPAACQWHAGSGSAGAVAAVQLRKFMVGPAAGARCIGRRCMGRAAHGPRASRVIIPDG